MSDRVPPFDFSRIARENLAERGGKVSITNFTKPTPANSSLAEWLDNLPDILAGREIRELATAIASARAGHRAFHVSMGAHVVKTGLGPVLADLLERCVITSVSVNGAFVLHDYEVAAVGFTSEDVDATLGDGKFGFSEQTGRAFADMVELAHDLKCGLGEAAARYIATSNLPHQRKSVLGNCYHNEVPVTVHAAIGTDIAHMYPQLDGAKLGRALLFDFQVFTTLVGRLSGGVYLNIGSAVILPEVFLKAISAVRNAGIELTDLTTANFDFLKQYRPLTNVVNRPTASGGRGYNFVGHHEILVPLLAAAVCQRLWLPTEDE